MALGTHDSTIRTSGGSATLLITLVIVWALFAALVAWIWHVSWIDPGPFDSDYRVNRGRFISVLGVPTLAVAAWSIGVTAGWIPFLWIRHYADGSLAVRTALGKLGLPNKMIRAPRPAVMKFKVVVGARPYKITLPAWNAYFSNGERQILVVTHAPFDEQELRAKLDGAHKTPARELH